MLNGPSESSRGKILIIVCMGIRGPNFCERVKVWLHTIVIVGNNTFRLDVVAFYLYSQGEKHNKHTYKGPKRTVILQNIP